MKQALLGILISIFSISAFAQVSIKGYVYNGNNKNPLVGANIVVQQSENGTTTNQDGYFEIIDLKPSLYTLEVSYTGFKKQVFHQLQVNTISPIVLEVKLEEQVNELEGVEIRSEAFKKTMESPLAVKNINRVEVQAIPGAVMDVSKAIQSLPGVLPRVSFGYGIIVRGGASNENRFFLDGIEIPAINHFNVMGATGGPNGLINFDMLSNTNLYSSAFPAEYGNALSSVLDMQQREGRTDRIGGKIIVGYTDYGAVIEGPLGKKANYLFSYRKSFSEYYLKSFDVPVLPAYSDYQFRTKINLDAKNELILTGLGGNDKYRLNLEADASDALLYNVGYIPEGDQSLYAFGANYKHYLKNSYYNFVVSRNSFTSVADKFKNNSGVEADRLLKYKAEETDNRLRFEHNLFHGDVKYKYGINIDQSLISVDNFALSASQKGIDTLSIKSNTEFLRFGIFGNYSNTFFDGALTMSYGFRLDGTNLNKKMQNPLNQFSPRAAISYNINEKWSLNSNAGIYYQLPPSIVIGYFDETEPGAELDFIRSNHYGLGVEYKYKESYRFSLELFSKTYDQYPFLLRDSIAMANALADYVVVGDQPTDATGQGRSYGAELYVQQKLKSNYMWMLSYTYSVSEFKDKNGDFVPSSWDTRHILSLSGLKRWDNNWQLGIRFRYADGTPYTPFDLNASADINNWNVVNRGIYNYNRLNQERIPAFHALDVRVDKHFFFNKWNFSVYLDVQNFYSASIELQPYLTVQRDDNFNPIVDPNNGSNYLLDQINSDTGRVLPTFGLIAEF